MFTLPVLVLEMWVLNKIGKVKGKGLKVKGLEQETESKGKDKDWIPASAGMTDKKNKQEKEPVWKGLVQPVFVVAMSSIRRGLPSRSVTRPNIVPVSCTVGPAAAAAAPRARKSIPVAKIRFVIGSRLS